MLVFIFIINLTFIRLTISWHAYDEVKQKALKNEQCNSSFSWNDYKPGNKCPCFEMESKPLTQDFIDELSLWPGLMSQFDLEHGESIYATKAALEAIHKSQNPENCREAKYIISGGWPYGFGSRIHMEGAVLAAAMNLNRVFLPHPSGDNIFWETLNPFCRNVVKDTSINCYYKLFSKCTVEDALYNYASDVDHIKNFYMADVKNSFENEKGWQDTMNAFKDIKAFNMILTQGRPWEQHKFIPKQIRPMLDCSPMREDAKHYYWRAMSATYLVRPNIDTLHLLNKYHTLPIHDYRDCIAMFVRHGDKGVEMKLLDFSVYRSIAEQMWHAGLVPGASKYLHAMEVSEGLLQNGQSHIHYQHNWTLETTTIYSPPSPSPFSATPTSTTSTPLLNNGTLFITTEDPAVLKEAEEWGTINHWNIVYTNLFDRSIQTAYKTWEEQHRKGTRAIHDDLEYFSMLLNLQYAVQCEAWICTLASNSCRIIDEMRATIGGKANRQYADLSTETCSDPPCIENHGNIKQFGDRRRRRRRLSSHHY
jgi:hypothetical protein